jgi:O-antigen/teichoic acid export membrane protein
MSEKDVEIAGSPSVASRVTRGTGWVVAWRVASRNLGLLSTLILVRLLKPEDFGLVTLASGFVNAVDSLSAIGVQDALVREPSPDRTMYDTAFSLNLLRCIATAAIIFALAWPAGDFFGEPRLVYVLLALGASMLLSGLSNIKVVDFRRNFEFHKEFNLSMTSRVVMILSTIGFALIWRSYWALVFGVIMNRLTSLFQSYIMRPFRPRLTFRSWRPLIAFSLWTWLQAMVVQVKDRADSIIIGRILGAAAFGLFSIAVEFGTLPVTELVEPLGRTLFSGFALLHRDQASPTRLYLNAIEAAVLLILPAGLGISMVADPMVRFVLGPQWLTVVPAMQIIAVVSTVTIFGSFSSTFLMARGNVRDSFLLTCLSVAIRIPVMVGLVYAWGLSGAAVAVAVTLMIDQGLFLWRTMRTLAITGFDLLMGTWRAISASLVMVGCLYALRLAWTPGGDSPGWSNFQDLLTRCLVGATTYAAALALAWILAGRPDSMEKRAFMIVRGLIASKLAARLYSARNVP